MAVCAHNNEAQYMNDTSAKTVPKCFDSELFFLIASKIFGAFVDDFEKSCLPIILNEGF